MRSDEKGGWGGGSTGGTVGRRMDKTEFRTGSK